MGKLFNKFARFAMNKLQGNELAQDLNTEGVGGALAFDAIKPVARKAAAEGIVLLKNNFNTLPIKPEDNVAVFGRCAFDYFAVGYGSGGDVQKPYVINIIDGLKNSGVNINPGLLNIYSAWIETPKNVPDEGFWGNWPMSFPEMRLAPRTAELAAKQSDIAIVVIGRAAGEDRENKLKKGSYYLTNAERKLLDEVTEAFSRVAVVLDCGNIIDMSWAKEYGEKIGAILYAWQGGMESGNAVADVLIGAVNPCGRLADTIANKYEDLPSAQYFGNKEFNNYAEDIYVGYRYFETFAPEKAMYPFGYGLSYTSFDVKTKAKRSGTKITAEAIVTNTGEYAGKEVVQVYVSAPQGVLGKAAKVLAGFAKTNIIEPGESETLKITFDLEDFASYDDSGATGNKAAYVLEAGEYTVYAGANVRDAQPVLSYSLPETAVVKQLSEVMAVKPEHAFKRMVNKNGTAAYEDVPTVTTNLKEIILAGLPAEIPFTGDLGLKLSDISEGKCTLQQFIAQLTPQELAEICHGEGKMNSELGTAGNAGAFGGVSESLREKGVPPIITVDGPAGIRLKKVCSLLPCGTALACTFDTQLIAEVYENVGDEMNHYNVQMLLAPGMNIHRDPLCGRNFEYFSEDPLLSGKIAAAVVTGLQNNGVSSCPKHFACNNQETNRNHNDSRLSERALREIYLKGFEIMVKESSPLSIMTSYNKINGIWAHYAYELVTTILREEWGYNGLIITDWWMREAVSPEFEDIANDAYRVRAQVDVLMPGGAVFGKKGIVVGGALLESSQQASGITLGEMQRSAENVLALALRLKNS